MAGIVGLTELQHTNATSALTIDTSGNLTVKTGTTTVKGEGTATTNLQQGLAKAWLHAIDNAVTGDDFNIASSTDNSTGDYTFTFTSAMGNTLFAVTATTNEDSHTNMYNWARTTTSYNVAIRTADNTFFDKNNGSVVHGDLA